MTRNRFIHPAGQSVVSNPNVMRGQNPSRQALGLLMHAMCEYEDHHRMPEGFPLFALGAPVLAMRGKQIVISNKAIGPLMTSTLLWRIAMRVKILKAEVELMASQRGLAR